MDSDASLAISQRSLADQTIEYPLWPPITTGCPETSSEGVRYPLEIDYAYEAVDTTMFDEPLEAGHERWAPLLPPLTSATARGEGNTPLVELTDLGAGLGLNTPVFLKDESQNPTWSHKDRANRCMVSAAVEVNAAGVCASTSGNHGAAAAAYAAAAGLPSVILVSPDVPAAVQRFIAAYGAAVLRVEGNESRVEAVDQLASEHGFHPVSSRTPVHTGHPFGPEGYKPIAYEVFIQLGYRVPGSVFVPTGHAELLFGVWKGFCELVDLGVADSTPRMVACEPAAVASLEAAVDAGEPVMRVDEAETDAVAIKGSTSSLRGYLAVTESDGFVQPVAEESFVRTQAALGTTGIWQERSAVAGVAGVMDAHARDAPVEPPVVCIGTSSGFKDGRRLEAPMATEGWSGIRDALQTAYNISL